MLAHNRKGKPVKVTLAQAATMPSAEFNPHVVMSAPVRFDTIEQAVMHVLPDENCTADVFDDLGAYFRAALGAALTRAGFDTNFSLQFHFYNCDGDSDTYDGLEFDAPVVGEKQELRIGVERFFATLQQQGDVYCATITDDEDFQPAQYVFTATK